MALPDQNSVTHTALAGGAALITLRGSQPGPTLALLGGVHGDEDEGVLAAHCVLQQLLEAPLAGTVRALAPAHPMAWAAHTRTNPLDAADLARSFPGNANSGPTGVLAAAITEEIIAGADLLIDLHSAGLRYQMPLFCGFNDEGTAAKVSRRAAVAFGAPIIWVHRDTPHGRSLSIAAERGIAALYAECSGGGSIRAEQLDVCVRGVLAVMAELDMLPRSFGRDPSPVARWVYGAGDLDKSVQSSHHGFFVSSTEAGATLSKGEEIGRIYGYQGRLLEVIQAPSSGIVMLLRRQARIQLGDLMFALAQSEQTTI